MSKNLLDLLSLSLFPKFKLGLVHNLLEETNNDVKKLCDSISNKYESKEIVSTKIIAEAIIEKTKLLGIHAIDYMDPYYPKLLKNIPTPPLVIYAKGNVELLKLQNKTISIVGTRQPDKYGVDNTKYFSNFFAKNNIPIVSGLAIGIDSISHLESVNMNVPTIAVLPGSIDNIYPCFHTNLAKEIINTNGLLLSEYPYEKGVDKKSFVKRNRIIAGLTPCTLVVQSLLRSGSLITARYAFEFDREVFAVPGNINSKLSEGCNHIISEASNIAKLTSNPSQILEYMGWN